MATDLANICFYGGALYVFPFFPVHDRSCCVCVGRFALDGTISYVQTTCITQVCNCPCHMLKELPIYAYTKDVKNYLKAAVSKKEYKKNRKKKILKSIEDIIPPPIEEHDEQEEEAIIDSDYINQLVFQDGIIVYGDYESIEPFQKPKQEEGQSAEQLTDAEVGNLCASVPTVKPKNVFELATNPTSNYQRLNFGATKNTGNMIAEVEESVLSCRVGNYDLEIRKERCGFVGEYVDTDTGGTLHKFLTSEKFCQIFATICAKMTSTVPKFYVIRLSQFASIREYISNVQSIHIGKKSVFKIAQTLKLDFPYPNAQISTIVHQRLSIPFVWAISVKWGDAFKIIYYINTDNGLAALTDPNQLGDYQSIFFKEE